MKRLACLVVVASVASVAPAAADPQVSRTEVIDRAKAYAFYPWRARAANLTASCQANYDSAFVVGDFLGVAYDWGGFDSLFQFSKKIDAGYAAGSPAGGDVTSCTTGVDCSGFVSQTWRTSDKYGTSTLDQISSAIGMASLLPGDAINDAGTHVVLYGGTMTSGEPLLYEAAGFNTRVNAYGGWSWVDGYVPRRYQNITGTSVADPVGTLNHPIAITSFPFSDSRDTRTAPSNLLDGCGASPSTPETGPEYVYQVQITEPGTLTVAVADDAGVDIDVHLMTSTNASDCTARADVSFNQTLDCGTYYIVADTYGGASNAGNYDLTVTFAPTGGGPGTCGSGPPGYDPDGQLGDACAYPDHSDLPGCNSTLGAEVCLYTTGANATSFCTASCATDADCGVLPGGGCCAEIGSGEHYCLTMPLCATDPGDTNPTDPNDPNNPTDPDDPTDPDNPGDMGQGGCAAGSTGGAWWLVLGGFGLIALRRRRR